jgi:hypothetical protein
MTSNIITMYYVRPGFHLLINIFDFIPYVLSFTDFYHFGPSEVRALPLAAGINVGGHYKWHF